MSEMSFAFWSTSWVSSKQMGRYIFFRLQRVTWYFCFSQRTNSNRGHESSLLALAFTKYLEVAIVLYLYANVTRYFYFLLQREFDTLVFHKGVNSIRGDESWAFVSPRCLLFLARNGNLTLLFFTREYIQLQLMNCHHLLFLVPKGNRICISFRCLIRLLGTSSHWDY